MYIERLIESELLIWKNKSIHLPILLRGARQVGKSRLVQEFAKKHFQDFVCINFEAEPRAKEAFSSLRPQEVVPKLELILNKPITPGKTLLFFDEIQTCPEALTSLRYFKEELAQLHVIAAGSLLEFLLNDDKFSFPVGRVEFLYLRPISLVEYINFAAPLMADRLKNFDLENKPSAFEHDMLMQDVVRKYFFIGGMPAAVLENSSDNQFIQTQRVHQLIIEAYASDFGKHYKQAQTKHVQKLIQTIPALVGQVCKFSKLDPDARARELKPALELLARAGIVSRVLSTNAAGLPLMAQADQERYKLFFLDIGLLQTTLGVSAATFFQEDLLQINSGALAEQFVAQELLASGPTNLNNPLLFWERKSGDAEVDFVIQFQGQAIPIEVKRGTTGMLKSLNFFLKERNAPLGVRVSSMPLSLDGKILSVPFYMVSSLEKLITQALAIRS